MFFFNTHVVLINVAFANLYTVKNSISCNLIKVIISCFLILIFNIFIEYPKAHHLMVPRLRYNNIMFFTEVQTEHIWVF